MLWSVQWCDLLVYRVWILLEYEYEFLIASKLLCNTLESYLSELVAETLRVNVWYPLVPTAYASLLVSVTCCGWFCELLCSLWFFSGCIWLRSASIGFLPILAVLRYWTADIWLLQQWCYGIAFKPLVDMHF